MTYILNQRSQYAAFDCPNKTDVMIITLGTSVTRAILRFQRLMSKCRGHTEICFSSLDVSECSYREFLQCTIKNALFEFLFVMLNQKHDFSFFESYIYNKN